jgi:dipeptidyl aminopeptidase/acylaminoacyl peptidase
MTTFSRRLRGPVGPFLALLALASLASASAAGVPQEEGDHMAGAPSRPIAIDDLGRLMQFDGLQVAPDGRFAVYALRGVHGDATAPAGDGHEALDTTHLWWLPLGHKGGEPQPLTRGARGASGPRIAPDGRTLLFLRPGESRLPGDDLGVGRAQVWLLPLEHPGEARQLSFLEHGVARAEWLADGEAVLLWTASPLETSAAEAAWEDERPHAPHRGADPDLEADATGDLPALRRWLALNESEKDPRAIHRMAFQEEQGLAGEARVTHLVRLERDAPGEGRRLTEGAVDYRRAEPSPDGRWVAYVERPPGRLHPDRVRRGALYRRLLDDPTAAAELLLDDEAWDVRAVRWSPDGARLYLGAADAADPAYAQARILEFSLEDRTLRVLGAEIEGHLQLTAVGGDGTLLALAPWQGATALVGIEPRQGRARQLVAGEGMALAAAEGGGRVLVAMARAADPAALYEVLGDGRLRLLAEPHGAWLDHRKLSLPKEGWATSPDGTRVQYWAIAPLDRGADEPGPTLLSIHGGPAVMWGPATPSMWLEWQFFAARGYGVVFANPRGSSGYGRDFQGANHRDWGPGPSADVLAALEHAAEHHGWIDPQQLFLTGGSYGGYLTAWIVAHDHRFRAAAAQRGVYDLATFFGEGNAWRLVERAFGPYPWDEPTRALLDAQSPFRIAERIRTPLLIKHADRDLRTGVSQSEMLYRALKELERPVEYLRYPGEGHELSRSGLPRRRVDRLLRLYEWFERFREG